TTSNPLPTSTAYTSRTTELGTARSCRRLALNMLSASAITTRARRVARSTSTPSYADPSERHSMISSPQSLKLSANRAPIAATRTWRQPTRIVVVLDRSGSVFRQDATDYVTGQQPHSARTRRCYGAQRAASTPLDAPSVL